MDIGEALRRAVKEEGWSTMRLAYEAGVGELSARQWLRSKYTPMSDKVEILRAKSPALRRILDEMTASIRVEDSTVQHAA